MTAIKLADELLMLLRAELAAIDEELAKRLEAADELEAVEDKPINSLRINCAMARLQSLSHFPGLPWGIVFSITSANCSSLPQLVQLFKLSSLPPGPPSPILPWHMEH